jgi:hypothetical protein
MKCVECGGTDWVDEPLSFQEILLALSKKEIEDEEITRYGTIILRVFVETKTILIEIPLEIEPKDYPQDLIDTLTKILK